MQDQQDIQSVKTWQAPQLMELGDVASNTQFGTSGANADATNLNTAS